MAPVRPAIVRPATNRPARSKWPLALVLVALVGMTAAGMRLLGSRPTPMVEIAAEIPTGQTPPEQPSSREPILPGMVLIPGGRFQMGGSDPRATDEQPLHMVSIREFWLDRHEVTNRQFAKFIEATGYITAAEQFSEGLVYDFRAHQWQKTQGADWRHPDGPASSIAGRDEHPVVQVSWYDAVAYARWAGKRLPTEAEWEYAARGGLFDADFPWGRQETDAGHYQANYWQGWFPDEDRRLDGFAGRAPVESFAPNPYGLSDMSGNVWEWCADWYAEHYYESSPATNPLGPAQGKTRVRRGGSWMCAENSGLGIRVAARANAAPTTSTSHVGFRCAK